MIIQFTDKELFVSRVCWYLIYLILFFLLMYIVYMRQLESRECSFMDGLYSTIDGNLRSINESDPNCGYTLKDYYIKTAYNCCNGGNYKNDFVSLCNLKDVIKQGVRCLDFEIYNIEGNPVIASSTQDSYYIKETLNYINFSDALSTIANYAFSGSTCPNSTDPILIHLRIKSNDQDVYTNMANILTTYDNYLLGKEYSFENRNRNLGDVPLLSLKSKIIIIVDRLNTAFFENKPFLEYVNITSNSIFMRALNYYDVKYTPDLLELQTYNKKNMTIALPDTGSNPANSSGIVVREAGCQMIAMRYQQVDQYLLESTLFFDKAGYAFVLKPERLRFIPVTIPDPIPQDPSNNYATRSYSEDYYSFNI